MNTNPSLHLKNLIELLLAARLDVSEFCEEYERLFNFELEKKSLPEGELRALERLFNKVVYYSPFAEERKKIPNYLGDKEIVEGAQSTLSVLSK